MQKQASGDSFQRFLAPARGGVHRGIPVSQGRHPNRFQDVVNSDRCWIRVLTLIYFGNVVIRVATLIDFVHFWIRVATLVDFITFWD